MDNKDIIEKIKKMKITDSETVIKQQSMYLPAILAEIVFTKFIYQTNSSLRNFTKEILNISYKDYVYRSRTLLYSRIIKDKFEMADLIQIKKSLILIQELLEKNASKQENTKKRNRPRKKTQQEVIKEWSEVINPDDK